jgi:hypothetical protein
MKEKENKNKEERDETEKSGTKNKWRNETSKEICYVKHKRKEKLKDRRRMKAKC